jgi:hypothetical protein
MSGTYWKENCQVRGTTEPGPVVHSCNPNYLGGRDQEDRSLRPAQANTFERPYLENTQHKKGLAQVVEHLRSKNKALSSHLSTEGEGKK